MNDNNTLDRIDFEKLRDQASLARAECMRNYGAAFVASSRRIVPQRTTALIRAHPVIAIVAILVISFGVKMFLLSAPTAEAVARPVPNSSMNILQMHTDHPNKANLPRQQMNDMTFVNPLP
jgi:hypothetical protein